MFASHNPARLLAVSLLLTAAACGGGGDAGNTAGEGNTPGGTPAATPATVTDPATIRGTITLAGSPPPNAKIDMSEEPTCAQLHASGATTEDVVANNGQLANVFVYIKEGVTGGGAPPAETVVIDQQGCVYIPHVVGVQAGQTLTFRNSDDVSHNVKAVPTTNRGFNISQPNKGMESPRTFDQPEVMVPIECNVHGWMKGFVGVVGHPYFAVSGTDGTFTIANLPAGTYTVETWHEKYGTQTQQVTVGPNETKDVTFGYNAAAPAAHVPMGKPIDPHGSHGAGAH
jgi:plastocyanin